MTREHEKTDKPDSAREDRYADLIITAHRDGGHPHATARAVMAVADAEQAELRAEVATLTSLLGSHADGHRCTCVMTDPGNFYVEGGNAHPPEWEQDPWCPTHPDVDQIKAQLLALADDWDAKADDGEEYGHAAAARAVRVDAKELRAALDGDD